MTRNLLSSPRRRGVFGAIIGAILPYALWASNNGIALGGNTELQMFVCGFSVFFGILGYGFLHGGFQGNGIKELGGSANDRWTETDADNEDLVHQNGLHASTRTLWDDQYK